MDVTPIRSSHLRAVGYDGDTNVLRIVFDGGEVYDYSGVPGRVFQALFAAQPHPWTTIGSEVRTYPYKRVR